MKSNSEWHQPRTAFSKTYLGWNIFCKMGFIRYENDYKKKQIKLCFNQFSKMNIMFLSFHSNIYHWCKRQFMIFLPTIEIHKHLSQSANLDKLCEKKCAILEQGYVQYINFCKNVSIPTKQGHGNVFYLAYFTLKGGTNSQKMQKQKRKRRVLHVLT